MSENSEFRELMARVRAGDQQAAKELVQKYEPFIRTVVRHRLRDPALRSLFDSMDICQSIFGNFFKRVTLGQFELDTPEQVRRLLVTMALNNLLNKKRELETDKRNPGRIEESSAVDQVADPRPTPSQEAAYRELLQKVPERLSEKERQLAELRVQGYSWKEIADRLGEDPDALRMCLDRAIKRVRRELGLDGED